MQFKSFAAILSSKGGNICLSNDIYNTPIGALEILCLGSQIAWLHVCSSLVTVGSLVAAECSPLICM